MLDIKLLRQNPDIVREAMLRRGISVALDDILRMDEDRRRTQHEMEQMRAGQNRASEEIARKKKAGEDTSQLLQELKQISDCIKDSEERLRSLENDLRECLLMLPNIPHESVPFGKSSEDNPVVRTWGQPRSFDFEVLDHVALGERLGIIDFERAAKIAGARFTVMRGRGAQLERALIQFMLDLHTKEHGYTEILPPFMVNSASMLGTGQLPKFAQDLFRVQDFDLWLIPTAEVPVTNLHRDEILDLQSLPIAYVAYTPCFRSEAGSYGKDTRGMIRQHQFNKVELVRFSLPEDSWEQLELLTHHAETVLQRLELPYRVVTLCTGDLGFAAAKTYDLEVWLPSQKTYREISSCSNFTDFQARRANIRFKRDKKTEFVHTLNGSGLAVGRTVVAILENFQQADGSVWIPPALRPYLGGMERIEGGRA